jgi:hypothetical protein
MGYTTKFDGEIRFNRELVASEIVLLKEIFEFDPRGGDYVKDSPYEFYYIDLELNETLDGIAWNGAGKSYGMVEQVQYVVDRMIEKAPDLVFNGEFLAQGEEHDDRWKLIVTDNKVSEVKIVLKGKRVECPHCGEEFTLEEEEGK